MDNVRKIKKDLKKFDVQNVQEIRIESVRDAIDVMKTVKKYPFPKSIRFILSVEVYEKIRYECIKIFPALRNSHFNTIGFIPIQIRS